MLIDGHVHYDYPSNPKKLLEVLEITNCDYLCLESQIHSKKINQNFDVFYAKSVCKGKVYVDIALDLYLYYNQDKMDEMPKYISSMMGCGADGVKMIEGKPTERKMFPIPNFDDLVYDSTFSYLEEKQIPITWHVNDPEEFWDEEKVPHWAKRSGWFYADGTYVNNIDQYRQIEALLARHPKLNITFAHFFFLSNDLKHLSYLFDKYPNISVDITPGIELFTNMSKKISEARVFFKKYSNRILYGTDISVDQWEKDQLNKEDAITRKTLCHDFLSKDKVFIKGDANGLLGSEDLCIKGLGLDEADILKIEYQNFIDRYHGIKELGVNKIIDEIVIHRNKLKEMNLDYKYLVEIEEYFKKIKNNV